VLSASFVDDKFAWYENDGAASPTFTERLVSQDGDGPRSVVAADIDGDGDLDVIGASLNDDEVSVFENPDGQMAPPTTAEDTPLVFSTANGNLISVSDVDLGSNDIKVRLEATNGTVTLAGITGLTLDIGSGTNDAVVEFRGSLADVNLALDGLAFTPTTDFSGIAILRILTDDQGFIGTGGALTDDDSINITVSPASDAPVARPDGVHLSFDGDDMVRIADHPSLQMTNNVTMEAWINPAVGGTGSQLILNKEGEYELGITADTGEIKFAFANQGAPDFWSWHNTGHFVTAGEWTHVAVTYDGVAGEARTYINGVLVDTFSQSGALGDVYPTFNDLTIGGRGNDTLERFQGLIDEVRVWSSTRSPAEIASTMNGPLTGGEVSLVGNWRLDEAAGSAVIDQSPFGNDGVLGGGEGIPATPTYQGYFTDQNSVLNVAAGSGVLANDFDGDLDPLTVTNLDTTGMLGSLVLNTVDGSFSYDPAGAFDYLDVGEQATETFTYTANDGSQDSNVVT
ncbi:MAG: LamG-like jellyroll fold domain-containing protein, partial [Sedimenticolaceae bacterium]